jgi:hypothetical protein
MPPVGISRIVVRADQDDIDITGNEKTVSAGNPGLPPPEPVSSDVEDVE